MRAKTDTRYKSEHTIGQYYDENSDILICHCEIDVRNIFTFVMCRVSIHKHKWAGQFFNKLLCRLHVCLLFQAGSQRSIDNFFVLTHFTTAGSKQIEFFWSLQTKRQTIHMESRERVQLYQVSHLSITYLRLTGCYFNKPLNNV